MRQIGRFLRRRSVNGRPNNVHAVQRIMLQGRHICVQYIDQTSMRFMGAHLIAYALMESVDLTTHTRTRTRTHAHVYTLIPYVTAYALTESVGLTTHTHKHADVYTLIPYLTAHALMEMCI